MTVPVSQQRPPNDSADNRPGREFLAGGGEMGARIRAYDWASSPIGSPETWPQTLKTVVRLALSTRHPIFIFWGTELICLYNDAYRASLGPEKHPAILGARGKDAWPENWDIIGPQIELVMRGEGATWHENQLVPVYRYGGIQDVYWTYSYGPIDDPDAPSGVGGVLVICTETTHQVLAERRSAAETERLRGLFAQSPGFVCVLRGPDHVFEFANAAYQRLVGGRDLVGRRAREAFPEAVEQGFVDLLDTVYASGQPYVGQSQRFLFQPSPDAPADERFLDFVYQPIVDGNGTVTGIFVEGSDVTARKQAERERQALLDMLAHDLKSPLTALKTQAQFLRRSIARHGVPDAESLTERVSLFVELADRMSELIGDLGDQARPAVAQTAELELDRRQTDLAAMVEEAIAELGQSGGPHQLRFERPRAPVTGEWDPHLLRRVVANLIGNAVKYSPGGGVVTARVSLEDGEAVLTVSDEGIGIPPADLPRIFELRQRGGNVGAIAGSGIGLAGVKRIVERHGGTITAESELGRGTTVTVRLPLAP